MNYIQAAFQWLNDPLNWSNPNGVWVRLGQHLYITAGAVGLGCLIALPLGIWFGHTGRGGGAVIAVSNMTRSIPTVALLTVLYVALDAASTESEIFSLAIFAIPPLLANAYTGMREVDPQLIDAASGMGMSGWQRLRRVELPLALPYLLTGFRTATVQVIATATLAALVGGDGLGAIINEGFGKTIAGGGGEILAGGFLVAVLALLVNALISVLAWFVTPKPLRGSIWFSRKRALQTI